MIIYRLEMHPIDNVYVVRQYEVTKQTPKYAWLAPRGLKNEATMNYSVRVTQRSVESEYYLSPAEAKSARVQSLEKTIATATRTITRARGHLELVEAVNV